MHVGATWREPLNDPSVATMRPYDRLLWVWSLNRPWRSRCDLRHWLLACLSGMLMLQAYDTIREAIKRALRSWHKSASSTARKEKLKNKKRNMLRSIGKRLSISVFYYDHVQLRLNGLTNRAGLLWRRAILCIQWGHIVVKDINFGIQKNIKTSFYTLIKTLKHRINNMIDIRCVTCSSRISEGSKAALSGDLQLLWYIIIAML